MKSLETYIKKFNNHDPIVFNMVLWLSSFVILLFSFTQNIPKKIDYIYAGSFLITISIPVLINIYVLIPRLLKQEKYLIYIMSFMGNLILFTQLNLWFFTNAIDYIFPEYYFISYHSNTKLITIFSIFLIATTLIKLSEDWFYFNKNENQILKVKNQQIQAQLTHLRSQINPHFLFNSLNVIYSLAIEKKEETKDAIVQLSDILRYVIYDSNTERVSLKEEIILLKNYIEFQKFRHQRSEKVTFDHHIDNEDYSIYPMLLLPLVENSFKHGIKGELTDTFINMTIEQKEGIFHFYIENNHLNELTNNSNMHSGLGIETIRKNLNIVYRDRHEFQILKTQNSFAVSLKLFKNEN